MDTEGKKLFLLDAYALIYRAYYALMRSPRMTTDGLNTSAIFGFCNTLEDVLKKENPDYIAVCFDPKGGHTFRHDVYPEYKAQRDKQPEDITTAIPYIKNLLAAYRIPVIEMEGYEADDIIGTISRCAEAAGLITYMMTPDKDYGQLVTDRVLMYRPALGGQGFEVRDPARICERYGIERPSQVIDLLALEGDASDNIPGCPGVGEKTAAKLIVQYGSVENLLDNIGELKGALQRKVADNVEQIRFSKYLVTIKTDVPIELDVESLRRQEPDVDALVDIFDKLEFKTMVAKYATGRSVVPPVQQPTRSPQGSLFDDMDDISAVDSKPDVIVCRNVTVLDTIESVRSFISEACRCHHVGVSVEAIGDEAMTAMFNGVALATDVCVAYIPMPDFDIERSDIIDALRPLFKSQSTTLVGHDIKRQMLVLRRCGLQWTAPYFDVSVAHYIISPEGKHDIVTMAFAILQYKMLDYDLSDRERKKLKPASLEEAAAAAGERATMVLQLKPELCKRLEADGQMKLYTDIEAPFTAVLAAMEWEGVYINVAELNVLSRRLTARVADLENEIFAQAGTTFNINSPAQVGEVLFDRLAIDPAAKRTKSGAWSTTEEILEKYASAHPVVRMILEIRRLRKLLTTYVDALPTLINPSTGKIHTTYNQVVTATGRISSANPNLQNIPVRTDDGREIRRAFIPAQGDLLLSADYSQIELRLMAEISGDPDMIAAFSAGEDIHRATAAKIFHVNIADVSDDQRRKAKTANFGIIYGISAFGLSTRLDISRGEAKELIENYMRTYPRVSQYMKEVVERARADGYVSTLFGRKRYLPDINSRNSAVRGYAERNAINAPLQGSAADIIKIAMVRIYAEMLSRNMRSRMIMQVHDELVFNVKPDELQQLQQIVVEAMTAAYVGRVNLDVACGVGHNWLEAH